MSYRVCNLIVDLCRCVYGRYVVVMSLPVRANFSNTVKTHVKERALWGFRLMLFLYILAGDNTPTINIVSQRRNVEMAKWTASSP